MPTIVSCSTAAALALVSLATAAPPTSLPEPTAAATVIVSPGIRDDFDSVREAVDRIKRAGGRDYRVVVVDSSDGDGGAADILPRLVDRWWQARTEGGGYDPSGDVTILLDVGDRSLAMDVPPSLLAEAAIDLDDLERDVIERVFVPRAKDMKYADGLAELVTATEQTIQGRIADRVRRAHAAEVFRTRTLPLLLAGLAAAAVVGWLASLRLRHARRRAIARDRLAAFKQEVVALSDLLDEQRERHRMLPHADADFKTPMTGMTRTAYDAVQDAIGRYRERWLTLMDVWERADKRFGDEWFLGTAASDDVIAMLDAADARPPLDEVAASCRAPLDALESSHERARELAAVIDGELGTVRGRLAGLASRARSAAPFEAALAAAARERQRGGDDVEADPVAARGRLEEVHGAIAELLADVEAVEATDDRRRQIEERIAEIRRLVAARRGEGWLLAEPGADPDRLLAEADREATQAAAVLDAADTAAAATHLGRAETAAAEAATLVESIVAARGRAEALTAAVAGRIDSIASAGPRAAADLATMRQRYADSAWDDLAGNPARAAEAVRRAAALLDEGRAAADSQRQHFFRAVAALEEAERQADWAATCLAAISGRSRELEELAAALPAQRERVSRRVAELAASLARQRTDRIRANERCREAGRILEAAAGLAAADRLDPRLLDQAIRAADAAAVRGEELAAEDDRLATQAAADMADAEGLVRRAASWYAEGVKVEIRSAEAALESARDLLGQQRYEEAIHAAGESTERTRLAYAAATAEADRRRAKRIAEQRQRQLEESFGRLSRGAGPWVISLPGGGLTGPNPWRSSHSAVRASGSERTSSGNWSRDVAGARW